MACEFPWWLVRKSGIARWGLILKHYLLACMFTYLEICIYLAGNNILCCVAITII